jgi:hypothetical protein
VTRLIAQILAVTLSVTLLGIFLWPMMFSPRRDMFHGILYLTLLVVWAGCIFTLYYRRRQAGAVNSLLVVEQGRWSAGNVVLGILIPWMMFGLLLERLFPLQDIVLAEIVNSLAWIALGWFSFLIGRTPITFAEEGIFTGLRLVKWSDIRSYRWQASEKDVVLHLNIRHITPFLRSVRLDFDPRQRAAVRALLQQKIRSLTIPGDPAIQQINYPADVSG